MESKIEATRRLQEEGRWDEASMYRDQERRRLRSQGKRRAEAAEEAWKLMIEKFPPRRLLADDEAEYPYQPDDVSLDAIMEKHRGTPTDFTRDALWVYENLLDTRATAEASSRPGM